MSSDNPIPDIVEGATKGFLNWSTDKISSFVKKFKNKELVFVKDIKTIERVKEQYNSGEGKFYEKYIKDREILLLVRLGLTLRKLETEDQQKLKDLRDKIYLKYKVRGLHISEFVQNGILNRCVGILLEELTSIDEFEKEIEEILGNIEKHALFIRAEYKPRVILKKVSDIINAHQPYIFTIAGTKSAAKVTQDCIPQLKSILGEYDIEEVNSKDKEILFFKRKINN